MPLSIIREDITRIMADAIVNPTNREMIGTGGTDLAVHRAAGRQLDAECIAIAPLGVGQVKVTKGYRLPCRFVIHTVGPEWVGGHAGEEILLRATYTACLQKAVELGCETVAMPLISAGTHGFPKDRALRFATSVITDFLMEQELTVALCVYDRDSYEFSRRMFSDIRALIDDAYVREREAGLEELVCASVDPEEDASVPPPAAFSMERPVERRRPIAPRPYKRIAAAPVASEAPSLEEMLRHMDKGFRETLFAHIDRLGITDVECYKRANVDKRTFSKLKSNKSYRPSKTTAVAFAVALGLTAEETQQLLSTAGMTLSNSSPFDVIVRYFIERGCHNVFEINEALFEFDQPLLGSV
jgi:O-acetyl-ADP-ribose deacetylase (regulator of RNase III)